MSENVLFFKANIHMPLSAVGMTWG